MVAPHPELISTLSCEAALCGSQGLFRALQAAWPRQGLLRASGRAGASPLPAKLWFFLSVVSFLCVAVRCSPPATYPAIACCSATPSLLSRLFCKAGLKRKMRWCDTQKLLFRLAKQQNPCEQVNNSKDPGNVSWGTAALHLLLLCIWDVLKCLLVIIPNYLIILNYFKRSPVLQSHFRCPSLIQSMDQTLFCFKWTNQQHHWDGEREAARLCWHETHPGGSWHRSGKEGNRLGWKEAVGNSWIALMDWVETGRWVK